ncbi:IS110 family RNA-guided transposase [Modicisalibacter radicis]|uniref:IS110 family transposase n=1 Tax=Halomonas sp. EAR18 TaxID=2518972 RepID=UPI00109D65F1|nr:IS110 family transposase [Halomonas sp. EAR18]
MAVIGIDISKQKLDCAWLRDVSTGKVKTRVFPNRRQDFPRLLEWLEHQTGEPQEQLHVVMEATGIYHETLAYWLHAASIQVSVLNPAQVRDFSRSLGVRGKTDKKDSVVLARYGATQDPEAWQPEPEEVRKLKALAARLDALDKDIQRERNRREKAEFAMATDILRSIYDILLALTRERNRLQQEIDDHLDQHPGLKQDRALLQTIPGVGPAVSLRLLATLRSRVFESARQAAAFAGVVPVSWESGSSVRGRPRLSKAGNPKLRQSLYMSAVVGISRNPDISALYRRLIANGKSKMAALGAAMRKLIHIAYGVLKTQTEYRPQAA